MPFKSVGFERSWWRLFQKRVVRIKFDIYVFIYGLIIKLGINVIDTYNFSNTILELNVRTHTEMPRI
jgi:hypothetical protein